MILDALRYPLVRPAGRQATLYAVGELLAVAVCLRFAAGLYPVSLLLVPLAGALVALVALWGTLAAVLASPSTPVPSLRGVVADGAVASAIAVAVLALPVALLLGSVQSMGGLDADLGSGPPVFALLGSTSALVAFLAATYVLPALVVGAVEAGHPTAGFDRGNLRRRLREPSYFLAWTVGLPLLLVGWALASFAAASSSVGGLLVAAIAAYCLLAGAFALGAGYRASVGEDEPGASER